MSVRYTSSGGVRNHRRSPLYARVQRAIMLVTLGCTASCESCERVTDPSTIELSLNTTPNEQRVAQGATTLYTVTVRRTGFTGPVSLSVPAAGLPPGVTVEFDPQTLPAGVNESIARVSVSATTPVVYVAEPPITELPFDATGPDGIHTSSNLRVRLVPSSLAGITINVTPSIFTLNIGEAKEALVTVARQGNYTGTVALSFPNEYIGIGSTITPVTGAADTWRVRFSADSPDPLLGTEIPYSIRATLQGLEPISALLRVVIVRPTLTPNVLHEVRMAAGGQDTVTVLLARSIGFTVPIPMVVDSAPTGITGTFSPNPAVDDASLLTVRAASSVAPGAYQIRVRAAAPPSSGAAEQVTRVKVTVDAPPATGSYTMSAPNMNVVAGSNTSSIFSLTRTGGFTGAVSVAFTPLTAPSLPAGMSITLDQNPILQDVTTIRLNTASTTPAGTYQLRATGTTPGGPTVTAFFTVVVTPTPSTSGVVRIELEPGNPEITAPATQQLAARLYDASGAVVAVETGGSIEYSSSNTAFATINPSTGLVSGVASGTTILTARYVRNGIQVVQASTPLFVYGPGSPGHYGSATMSTAGNARTIRRGESIMFQIIVRNTAGVAVTSGVSPAPVVTSSNPGVISIASITGPVAGYFFDMTAAFAAPLGTEVRIRYDVTGAGGELVIRVVP